MSLSRFFRTCLQRGLLTAGALTVAVMNGGWLDGPQSTFDTKGPVAETQLDVFYVTLWVTTIIFILVATVLAYATFKFKARSAADEHAAPPPQGHGNPLVELGLIFASVAALVIIAIPTLRAIWFTYDVQEARKDVSLEIDAIGFQWWFKFDYPSEEMELTGGSKAKLTVANELVIPAGRPVRINLRTYDVIHSFWVPKLAGKVDMIPNRGNHLWLEAREPGYFWGQCAEYCGESHAVMRFRVIALAEADYQAWLTAQKAIAREANATSSTPEPYKYEKLPRNAGGYSAEFDSDPFGNWKKLQNAPQAENTALIAQGRQIFQQKNCVTCHVVRGHHPAGASFAPDLTHVAARSTIAGGLLETNEANLHRWLTEPDNVKPGNKMWEGVGGMPGYITRDRDDKNRTITKHNITVNDDEARALVAYLLSLK